MKIEIFCILYRTFTLLRTLVTIFYVLLCALVTNLYTMVLELEDWVLEKLFEDEGWDDDEWDDDKGDDED